MVKQNIKSVYLISSSESDTEIVKQILIRNNYKIIDSNKIPWSIDKTFNEIIKDEIKKSDFVIGIISEYKSNFLFEMGIAFGLGKKILLIIENDLKIPFDIKDVNYIKYKSIDNNDLERMLIPLLNINMHKKQHSQTVFKKTIVKNVLIRNEIESYITLFKKKKNINEYDIMQVFSKVFELKRYPINVQHGTIERGIDSALWLNSLSKITKNPILIEYKRGNITENSLKEIEMQILKYIDKTSTSISLIIYLDNNKQIFPIMSKRVPYIMRFEANYLLSQLCNEELDTIILSEINKSIYSGE